MKIQYCSDLHLEFQENNNYLKQFPIMPKGDILVLAGDIVPFAIMDKYDDFFQYCSDHFKYTYWIPGNHEYYSYDMALKSGVLNESIKSNVFLVNNISLAHDNLRFIFSTLWSNISTANIWQIERSINDFKLIKDNGFRLSAEKFNAMHQESLAFISNELIKKTPNKTIVVTHHVPTLMNYPEQYKGDIINEAFAVELFNTIETSKADCWIYGHHHSNTPPFNIGKTMMLTNQLGYVKYHENKGFEFNRCVNI